MKSITIKYNNAEKTLPERIDFSITLNATALSNIFLKLTIGTIKKNKYTFFTSLSNSNGMIIVTKDELLKQIDLETNFSIMDYCGITNNFNGTIFISIPNQIDIQNALNAYQQFSKYYEYPKNYKEKLLILLHTIESKDLSAVNIEYSIKDNLK